MNRAEQHNTDPKSDSVQAVLTKPLESPKEFGMRLQGNRRYLNWRRKKVNRIRANGGRVRA